MSLSNCRTLARVMPFSPDWIPNFVMRLISVPVQNKFDCERLSNFPVDWLPSTLTLCKAGAVRVYESDENQFNQYIGTDRKRYLKPSTRSISNRGPAIQRSKPFDQFGCFPMLLLRCSITARRSAHYHRLKGLRFRPSRSPNPVQQRVPQYNRRSYRNHPTADRLSTKTAAW